MYQKSIFVMKHLDLRAAGDALFDQLQMLEKCWNVEYKSTRGFFIKWSVMKLYIAVKMIKTQFILQNESKKHQFTLYFGIDLHISL